MEQLEKTYREIIEEGDAQRELHRKQAEQDFNDPVFLREALELEYQDRRRVKRELAAANAEIARLRTTLEEILARPTIQDGSAYLSADANEDEFRAIKEIILKALQ